MSASADPGLLLKGLEEEVFTGRRDGTVVGLSNEIAADLQGFVVEPDRRNAEYAMPPMRTYEELGRAIVCSRRALRDYLRHRGDFTLLPGGSLALGDANVFLRANPGNPYHTFIERTYGSRVVTASTHINIGIEHPDDLIRAYRVIRAEAALYLALSASSPFVDGRATGYRSTRWGQFPKTPPAVPFFRDHAHYVAWVEAQLASGAMHNIRHLWLSVRPNGIGAPHDIQRLELRICDRLDSVVEVMAVTALLEARVHQVLEDTTLDPLRHGRCDEATLTAWADANEAACAKDGLNARVTRWDGGATTDARDWIAERLASARDTAAAHGFDEYLEPVADILESGNRADQWLNKLNDGQSVDDIYRAAIVEAERAEQDLKRFCLCNTRLMG